MSDTFCILPWVHSHIKPNGDMHLCSRKSIPIGNIHTTNIDELFNSDSMDNIRSRMLDGKTVQGCEKCYHVEKISEVSLRKMANWWFNRWLIDGVVEEWKDDIVYDGTDYNKNWIQLFSPLLDKPKIEWLGIHASNICNLSCRGCYSMLSSKWKQDEVTLGINPHPLYNRNLSDYDINFDDINFITMFGGEPLIMKQNDQLIELIDGSKNTKDKILQYYTNGTVFPNKQTLDAWKQLRKLQLFISIDGYGKDNDYFRHGSKWENVRKNVNRFIEYAEKYNWELRISTLVNIYNIGKLDILHNWLVENGVHIDKINYNICIYPQELDIRNLPQSYKDELLEIYTKINLPHSLVDMVTKQLKIEPNISFIASTAFSNKLDEIRGENNPIKQLKVYMNDE